MPSAGSAKTTRYSHTKWTKIDGHVQESLRYGVNIKAQIHRGLLDEEEKDDLGFDDVEIIATPSMVQIEEADRAPSHGQKQPVVVHS